MPAKLISLALVLHLREPSQFHCGNCTSGPSSAIKQGLLHRCLFSLVRTVAIEESVPKKCIAVPHRFIVKMISLSCFGVIVLISIMGINAFVPGDRISTLCQTYHGGFKSPWMDLHLQQMPKFGWPDAAIIQTNLPRREANEPEMRLNPNEDVKVSLTFARHKLAIPNIVLFDSQRKKSLLTLVVTFAHDDFEIISLKHEAIYGPPIARLDPQHPSLTAFEIVYRWDAVNDNDLRAGLIAMFITVLITIIGLMCYIVLTYDRDTVGPVGKPSTRRPESSRSSYTYDRSGGSGGGGYSEQYRN